MSEKKVILPGDKVNTRGSYTYKVGEQNYSSIYGILTKNEGREKLIPLSGKYIPSEGDLIVGVIKEAKFGGAVVDINSPYSAFLPTRREYREGDVVFAKIFEVDEVKSTKLGDERQLYQGEIIEISPVRVPRVIGKKNSMLELLKQKTGCNLFIGRNGRIWIKGDNVILLKKAILKIEKEAHTTGLTNKITKFLDEELTKEIKIKNKELK